MAMTYDDEKNAVKAPALLGLPSACAHRLIDAGLMQYEVSVAGSAERYRRGETPQTIHVWWARRPHRAMRALVYASLQSSDAVGALDDIGVLTSGSVPPPLLMSGVRNRLEWRARPKVLDMFGGGGTIGYEAALLGAEAFSVDSNELSVFIQKCLLVYSRRIPVKRLQRLVAGSGHRVLEMLRTETDTLFPLRNQAFGYLWTYSKVCTRCQYRFLLSKRPWLSRKRGRLLALQVQEGEDRQAAIIKEVDSRHTHRSAWQGRTGSVRCPRCAKLHDQVDVRKCRDELIALVSTGNGAGKHFGERTQGAMPADSLVRQFEQRMLEALHAHLPSTTLPRWSGIVNPALYGIETHSDFLGARQRAVLLALIHAIKVEFTRLIANEPIEVAEAVVCLLSGLIDQLVDWNCRLSMWISQNEQVGRAFSGPGVAMLWDYIETDPVLDGPANLWKKLERIVAGTAALEYLDGMAHVEKAYAQQLPYPSGVFDAIVTDPPYYDNVFYNVLSDFFFAWKRILFHSIYPELFACESTDASRELVASTRRSKDAATAHSDYCRELGYAISEAERVLKKDGVFALVYGHSSLLGWEAIVRAYRPTDLHVTSVQPLSIERKARPRAMTSDAVNTCVVFVSRKVAEKKTKATIENLVLELREHINALVSGLGSAGWQDADIGVAAISQAVGMLCNCSSVDGCENDLVALRRLSGIVRERIPSFSVSERKPM